MGSGFRVYVGVASWHLKRAVYTIDRLPFHHRAVFFFLEMNNPLHSYSHLWAIWESPVGLICMFLDCGWKLENLQETHAGTWRTCKLYSERLGLSLAARLQLLVFFVTVVFKTSQDFYLFSSSWITNHHMDGMSKCLALSPAGQKSPIMFLCKIISKFLSYYM